MIHRNEKSTEESPKTPKTPSAEISEGIRKFDFKESDKEAPLQRNGSRKSSRKWKIDHGNKPYNVLKASAALKNSKKDKLKEAFNVKILREWNIKARPFL